MKRNDLVFFFSLFFLVFSCGLEKKPPSPKKAQAEKSLKAFANRSQKKQELAFFLITLSSPPLLESYLGKEDLYSLEIKKEKLIAEQEKLLKSLYELDERVRLIYRYRLSLNALALVLPRSLLPKLKTLASSSQVFEDMNVSAPKSFFANSSQTKDNFDTRAFKKTLKLDQKTAHLNGKNIRIGMIDTGLDYRHQAFLKSAHQKDSIAHDSTNLANKFFPSEKVPLGIDLVGSLFNPEAKDFLARIPIPDADPLDERGHGTHVGGIIAARPFDKVWSGGVAEEAFLYPVKVFGKRGGTTTAVLLQAFEFLLDPNGDLDPKDSVHIINLSIGRQFGRPYSLYDQVVTRLARYGILTVASAGNSGDIPFVVSSPGTASLALTVGAFGRKHLSQKAYLASFSSRGPRSFDAILKPEILAPGVHILAPKMSGEKKLVAMSGTSMAAPFISGLAAILKQQRPSLSVQKLRSLLISSTKPLYKKKTKEYSFAQQGLGVVEGAKAVKISLLLSPSLISLGVLACEKKKKLVKMLQLTNLSSEAKDLSFSESLKSPYLKISYPSKLSLAAGEKKKIRLFLELTCPKKIATARELAARILVKDESSASGQTAQLGIYGLSLASTRGKAKKLEVFSSSKEDSPGSLAELTVENKGSNNLEAFVFNSLGRDDKQTAISYPKKIFEACDLEASGYRLVPRKGSDTDLNLEFAAQFYSPFTNWTHCEFVVQIDKDFDGQSDFELLGTDLHHINKAASRETMMTVLLDAHKLRQQRKLFEQGERVNYANSILALAKLNAPKHSGLMILSLPLYKLSLSHSEIRIKIASSLMTQSYYQRDDFFKNHQKSWKKISLVENMQAYYNLPKKIELESYRSKSFFLEKGEANNPLIIFFPFNKKNIYHAQKNKQVKVLKPRYVYQNI